MRQTPKTNQEPYQIVEHKGRQYGKVESFLLYKIIYPIVNTIGLNRQFNLFYHWLGLYHERHDRSCWWCGENHHEHKPN